MQSHSIWNCLIFGILCQCQSSIAEISTSNNQFGLKLYSAIASKSKGDFVLSPFPVTKLFAALYSGADGTLAKEIRESLQFPEGDEDSIAQVIRDYKRVDQDFAENESLTKIQSAIIFNNSLKISNDFNSILNNDLNISKILTNISDFNKTLKETMDWLDLPKNFSNGTAHFLQERLDENGTLALVSKSLFKATWVHPFHPSFTKPSPFYYDETHANQVDMMFTRATLPYAEIKELDCTAVALPFQTGNDGEEGKNNETENNGESHFHRLELIILLPNQRTGLPDLEKKLKSFPFSRIPQQFLETKDLFLYIPKFNASTVLDLSDAMEDLGIKSLTNMEKVDLSKVIDGEEQSNVTISNFFHIAQFSINENGSGIEKSIPLHLPNFSIKYISPESFRANRPFIGFLYDQEKHIILNIFRKIS